MNDELHKAPVNVVCRVTGALYASLSIESVSGYQVTISKFLKGKPWKLLSCIYKKKQPNFAQPTNFFSSMKHNIITLQVVSEYIYILIYITYNLQCYDVLFHARKKIWLAVQN